MGLDIGAKTAAAYGEIIQRAETIFWNGPMGVFEFEAFANGTKAIAREVARSTAFSVVCSGDSVRAVNESDRLTTSVMFRQVVVRAWNLLRANHCRG